MRKVPFLILFVSLSFFNCNMIDENNRHIIIGDSIVSGYNEWEIDSYGKGGARIEWMTDNIPYNISSYETVFILLGINNLASTQTPEEIKNEMSELLGLLNNKNIFVISILPIDENQRDFTDNEEIESTNTLFSEISNIINVFDYMNIEEYGNPFTRDGDGLHLTQDGYDVLEKIIYPYTTKL